MTLHRRLNETGSFKRLNETESLARSGIANGSIMHNGAMSGEVLDVVEHHADISG